MKTIEKLINKNLDEYKKYQLLKDLDGKKIRKYISKNDLSTVKRLAKKTYDGEVSFLQKKSSIAN